jgi:hypothetical protein
MMSKYVSSEEFEQKKASKTSEVGKLAATGGYSSHADYEADYGNTKR